MHLSLSLSVSTLRWTTIKCDFVFLIIRITTRLLCVQIELCVLTFRGKVRIPSGHTCICAVCLFSCVAFMLTLEILYINMSCCVDCWKLNWSAHANFFDLMLSFTHCEALEQ